MIKYLYNLLILRRWKQIKKLSPDLINRSPEEKANMVLICPVHKLMCTGCRHAVRLPKQWLSDNVLEELEYITKYYE